TTTANTSLGSFVQLLINVGSFSWNTVLIGSIALALMIVMGLTRAANVASLAALVVPTLLALWWALPNVELVADVSDIPSGLPPFALPDITLITPELVAASFAVAVVIAIQGAGVSHGTPNPDGSTASVSQ